MSAKNNQSKYQWKCFFLICKGAVEMQMNGGFSAQRDTEKFGDVNYVQFGFMLNLIKNLLAS